MSRFPGLSIRTDTGFTAMGDDFAVDDKLGEALMIGRTELMLDCFFVLLTTLGDFFGLIRTSSSSDESS